MALEIYLFTLLDIDAVISKHLLGIIVLVNEIHIASTFSLNFVCPLLFQVEAGDVILRINEIDVDRFTTKEGALMVFSYFFFITYEDFNRKKGYYYVNDAGFLPISFRSENELFTLVSLTPYIVITQKLFLQRGKKCTSRI